MLRKRVQKLLPSHESIKANRYIALFGSALQHPGMWHLNRRSVAGGVAVGLFCGLIPGPLQMLGAGILAILFRVNLQVALLTTLYTNPFTIVPLYFVAYKIGGFVMGVAAGKELAPPPDWSWSQPMASMEAFGQWALGLGAPLALGVFMLATLLAVTGYLLVRLVWSIYLRRAWLTRRQRRRL